MTVTTSHSVYDPASMTALTLLQLASWCSHLIEVQHLHLLSLQLCYLLVQLPCLLSCFCCHLHRFKTVNLDNAMYRRTAMPEAEAIEGNEEEVTCFCQTNCRRMALLHASYACWQNGLQLPAPIPRSAIHSSASKSTVDYATESCGELEPVAVLEDKPKCVQALAWYHNIYSISITCDAICLGYGNDSNSMPSSSIALLDIGHVSCLSKSLYPSSLLSDDCVNE